jgi:hypothetical protein
VFCCAIVCIRSVPWNEDAITRESIIKVPYRFACLYLACLLQAGGRQVLQAGVGS